jgi:hypothetical protein
MGGGNYKYRISVEKKTKRKIPLVRKRSRWKDIRKLNF